MSAFFDRMAATADRLITQFGQTVMITRDQSAIDPVTGVSNGAVPLVGQFMAINPPATPGKGGQFDEYFKGETGQINDKRRFLVVAAQTAPFAPQAGDVVTLGGQTFTVAGVTPTSPDGTPLVYKLGMELS